MKKQRRDLRKKFAEFIVFLALIASGGNLSAATRHVYFAMTTDYGVQSNNQCSPGYLPAVPLTGAPVNPVKVRQPRFVYPWQQLPSYGITAAFYGLSFNQQGGSCDNYSYTNNQVNQNSLYYSAWAGVDTTSFVSPIVNLSLRNVSPEMPLPAAIWLFGSAVVGMFGLGKRKQVKLKQ